VLAVVQEPDYNLNPCANKAEFIGANAVGVQGERGQWRDGGCFSARSFNWRAEQQGQPWTATLPTLEQLCDFGIDQSAEGARQTVAQSESMFTLTGIPSGIAGTLSLQL
jgi:hypothetical protein